MEAIVLAGGFGTRLRSVVSNVPKPMAPIAGHPFLELLLASLKARGMTRVIMSVGYMHSAITSYFEKHPMGLDLVYEIESQPLGTGGAIKAALNRVKGDNAFVLNGDTFLELDLSQLAAMWSADPAPIVVVRSVPDTARYGRVEIDNGKIVRFSDESKTGEGLINAGCYLIPTSLLEDAEVPDSFSFERDFLAHCPPLYLRAVVATGHFIDIGVPEDYARAQTELAAYIPR
jgi:D-glycero-alpha-D-manno-heptose 1-phosphate guanylyltransferase